MPQAQLKTIAESDRSIESSSEPVADWRQAFARIFHSGLFDHDWYASEYPCVWHSGLSPLEHFTKYGAALGRRPSEHPSAAETEMLRRILSNAEPAEAIEAEPGLPLVSIICITYNQARYIEQTLDGMLAQRTSFPIEIIVGDDCSSDGTAELISQYADEHPQIVPVLRRTNVGPNANFQDLARRVRGRFVAICEGDDYWTDTRKLQKQVDFFKDNPEYTVCFHKVRVMYEDHPEIEEFFPERCKAELPLGKLAQENCIQTNSVMYRWRFGPKCPFEISPTLIPGDWYTHLLQAKVGRVGYLDDVMAVYRRHSNGMWSPYSNALQRSRKYGNGEIEFFRQLKRHFGGPIRDHFVEAQKILLKRLILTYADDGDADALHALITANPDVCGEAMSELGFDPDTVTEPDAESLRKSIIGQSRISVIVTSHNHKDYIRACLDSILAQEGMIDLQIIIGDDNSPDGTGDIIAEYATRHPDKITVLSREQNVGMLQNMKDCLALADGQYIAFCEGDDYWLSPRKLMKQLNAVRPDPDVKMCFNWLLLELTATDSFVPHAEQSGLAEGEVPFFTLAGRPLTANFSCCFYRSEALSAVPDSYFSGTSSADWLFNLYVADSGKVLFLKELLSVYRIQERGQWSGLSHNVQHARTMSFKREFSEIFGRGRGFEDVSVKVASRTEAQDLPDGVEAAALDWPPIGEWFELSDGSVALRGWVLSPHRETSVVVRAGEKTMTVPLDGYRPDVLASLLGDSGKSDLRCGFCCVIPYKEGMVVELDFDVDGTQKNWLRLDFEDRGD